MSETAAKAEYDEWYALLTRHLGTNKALFCLDKEDMRTRKPRLIMTKPDDTASEETKSEYRKYQARHDEALLVFYERCDTALGILRSTFKFDCKASSDLEAAVSTIPLREDGTKYTSRQWTSDRKFTAAMEKLKAYAPQDSADVATLRSHLADLTDAQGFYSYFQEFTRTLGALDRAGARPSDSELTEWVKKGLRNETINNFVATSVITLNDSSPKYEVIFSKIEFYLKTRGEDFDPYKLVKSGPTTPKGITAMAASKVNKVGNTPEIARCTRCWNKGHGWADCKAKTCSACKTSIDGHKFCPNYAKHNEKATRFVPKRLLDEAGKEETAAGNAGNNSDSQIKDLKRKLSAMQASIDASAKKLKANEEDRK